MRAILTVIEARGKRRGEHRDMCGVAGVLCLERDRLDTRTLPGMVDIVAHRGPDGEGHLLVELSTGAIDLQHGPPRFEASAMGPFVYLGHRRLAIIDLSEAAAQPMASSDSRVFISFNGEIYNYVELRQELEQLGRTFRTTSDTEVIVEAYRAWGEACLHRFNGMWAIAVLDLALRRLILSVDRFGVKPLHYVAKEGVFAFGSEIKQLLRFVGKPRANETAVAEFVATGVTHRGEATCFEGVSRLMPGQTLSIDLDTGLRSARMWYSLPFSCDYGKDDPGEFERAAARFRDLFVDAVSLRMRSDVPVGSCLSGGLDSSAVVGVASKFARAAGGGARMHTFTACWEDPAIDEWPYAEAVVRTNLCDAHRAFPTWTGFRTDLDRLIWHQEEPFGSPSIFAQWSVMCLAREHRVPVLLDGQGSDEMLGGYEANAALHAHAALSESLLRGSRRVRALRASGYALGFREAARAMVPAAVNALYNLRIRREGGQPNGRRFAHNGLAATLAAEYTAGNLQTLLRYEDRNSMAFSIESRCPFMDYRLAEFAFSLPRSMLSYGGVLKPLLRTGLAEFLPDVVGHRVRKLGFAAPPFSLEGPDAFDTRGSVKWRRSMVARWRCVFGIGPGSAQFRS